MSKSQNQIGKRITIKIKTTIKEISIIQEVDIVEQEVGEEEEEEEVIKAKVLSKDTTNHGTIAGKNSSKISIQDNIRTTKNGSQTIREVIISDKTTITTDKEVRKDSMRETIHTVMTSQMIIKDSKIKSMINKKTIT